MRESGYDIKDKDKKTRKRGNIIRTAMQYEQTAVQYHRTAVEFHRTAMQYNATNRQHSTFQTLFINVLRDKATQNLREFLMVGLF